MTHLIELAVYDWLFECEPIEPYVYEEDIGGTTETFVATHNFNRMIDMDDARDAVYKAFEMGREVERQGFTGQSPYIAFGCSATNDAQQTTPEYRLVKIGDATLKLVFTNADDALLFKLKRP